MNRAFSAGGFTFHEYLGRCPRLLMNAAPFGAKQCAANAIQWRELPACVSSPNGKLEDCAPFSLSAQANSLDLSAMTDVSQTSG
jgi:hypothetical protein